MATTTSLEEATEQARQRVAAERERIRAKDDAGIASELSLLLRGVPASRSVLNLAHGPLAQLRDVMLARDDIPERRLAALAWAEAEGEDEEEQQARRSAFQLVIDNRDSRREALRLEVARERAGLIEDAFAKVDATPAPVAVARTSPPPENRTPPRTNPKRFHVTLTTRYLPDGTREERTGLSRDTVSWRRSKREFRKRAWRVVRQFELELTKGDMWLKVVDADTWRTWQERWKKRRQRSGETVRWMKLPQEDGSVAVFHDDASEGGEPVSHDTNKLYKTLYGMLWTPEGKRPHTTPGYAFGDKYAGWRGDGHRREAQLKGWREEATQLKAEGEGGIVGAAETLDIPLNKNLKGERELAHADAAEALYLAGYDLKPRSAHKDKLGSVLDAIVAKHGHQDDMSRIAYSSSTEEEDVRYTGHEPPPDDAQLAFVLAEQPPPAPLYLPGGGI